MQREPGGEGVQNKKVSYGIIYERSLRENLDLGIFGLIWGFFGSTLGIFQDSEVRTLVGGHAKGNMVSSSKSQEQQRY